MELIKGIDVTLYDNVKIGTDSFGADVYELVPKKIRNVLVYPSTPDDVINETSLHGKKSVYTLCIPKGDQHVWEDRIVEFFGRKWKTFGFSIKYIDENVPLSWNRKVLVDAYE